LALLDLSAPIIGLTLRGSYFKEFQRLDASFLDGLSANETNQLNTLRLQSSFAYGSDNRVVLTGQYFDTWGTSDALLYAGLASGFSPNSSGWIAEIAYIPFEMSRAPGWPWFNARIGLQYTAYDNLTGRPSARGTTTRCSFMRGSRCKRTHIRKAKQLNRCK
jgi:hypothetical protein